MEFSDKELNIYVIEDFYTERMSELVDEERFDDSHGIYTEFVLDSEEPDEWMFIKDLTNVY